MSPHRDSTKREGRLRVEDEIKGLPTDIQTDLREETAAYRYATQWHCAIYALSVGLRVMKFQRNRVGEVLNALEQTGTR